MVVVVVSMVSTARIIIIQTAAQDATDIRCPFTCDTAADKSRHNQLQRNPKAHAASNNHGRSIQTFASA